MMKLKRYEEAREMIQSWKQAMLVLAVMLLMMAGCQKKIVEDPSEPISDQVANRYEVDFDGDYRLENLEKTMDAYLTEANLATETKTRVYYTWDTSGEVNGAVVAPYGSLSSPYSASSGGGGSYLVFTKGKATVYREPQDYLDFVLPMMKSNWERSLYDFIAKTGKDLPETGWSGDTVIQSTVTTYNQAGGVNGGLLSLETQGKPSGFILAHIHGLDLSVEAHHPTGTYPPFDSVGKIGSAYLESHKQKGFAIDPCGIRNSTNDQEYLIKFDHELYLIGVVKGLADGSELVENRTNETHRLADDTPFDLNPERRMENHAYDQKAQEHPINLAQSISDEGNRQ